MTFSELQLAPELIAALEKQQISHPTPIQSAALPALLAGRDAYLHAETGTGKTLAYLLPIFGRLDTAQAATQTVIVAPTHELALQIHRQCCDLAQNAGWPVRSLLLIGGTSTERQIDKLKKKPHVVVGSPGRIAELIAKGKLKAQFVRSVVIDEADRLLSDESTVAVRAIIQAAPRTRQLIFASATLERESMAIAKEWAPELLMLQAGAAAVNENIEHLYLICEDERDKPDQLRKLLHALAPERAIVFVHRNDVAERIALKLAHHKIPAADLNAALHKEDRKRAMDGFRSGKIRVLITSDIAARGLDIKGVTHVFNFDVPTLSQAYLHRVGRTGRAGVSGLAVTLMTEIEARLVRRYQEELGIDMQRVRTREGKVLSVERP
ncbi:DEAD/DEAH box helicase [Steroidobacter agaridevorans]|uniref:DEAD/DEAH box helicase n=1 Tax=Steroidobacter agaridevorans TaxID=2695856 RepID=A0A829YBT8_9GAMM|nr:DEAD/DEAH box helicase [Steroidobacter agaridevorans]GFE80072.1 DEAD/DEAH box helicase [Steroidobacter agaridevorans]GFE89959.1 DEAD/DEAH box helicase [Steroidobacter agaridevorans]